MPVDQLLSHVPPRSDTPLRELSVGDALREAAAVDPAHLAFVHAASETRLTYGGLLDESERVARALLARFHSGEHVAVCTPNVPEFLLLQFGAALAGIVLVPVPPALRGRDLAHVLRESRAAGIVLTPAFRGVSIGDLVEEVRGELSDLREVISLDQWQAFLDAGSDTALPVVRPEDPSQIQFTSGSTGAPKGAILHHRGILNTARFVADDLDLTSDDVWLMCMPLTYVAGCTISVLAALQARATLVLCDFEPRAVLALMESERATVVLVAAAMLQMLLDHEDFATRDLASMRVVSVGGSTIAPELGRRAHAALGVPLTILYGLTEACGIVTQTRLDDPDTARTQTIGRPHPHVEAAVVDPDTGDPLPVGTAGELWLRGYFVMDGYLGLPDATAEAIDAAGWLHTGDVATLDEHGYLRITGRLKEIVNRGGRKIAPGEIEALLTTHPAVSIAAIVGVPDERLGEEIAAFIQLAPGATTNEHELAELCSEQLAPFKQPRHWVFLEQMPLTRSGKVHKPSLRERFNAADAADRRQRLSG